MDNELKQKSVLSWSIVYFIPIDERDHTSKLLDLEDKLSTSFQGGGPSCTLPIKIEIDQYTLI